MNFDQAAEVFRALGDPHRLSALHFLATAGPENCRDTGAVCACDLITHLGLAQPTVSHHMRVLTQAGLVTATRQGRWTHYTLSGAGLHTVQILLTQLQARIPSPVSPTVPSTALQAT